MLDLNDCISRPTQTKHYFTRYTNILGNININARSTLQGHLVNTDNEYKIGIPSDKLLLRNFCDVR